MKRFAEWPNDAELLPIAPLVYVAWADGTLTPDELRHIRDRLGQIESMAEPQRVVVRTWLDPEQPPSPQALERLLGHIRDVGRRLHTDERRSLADFGMTLRVDAASPPGEVMRNAVHDIESALGLIGAEEAANLLARTAGAPPLSTAAPEPTFDLDALRTWLDAPHAALRAELKDHLTAPAFAYEYELPREQYRERVLSWARELARRGYGRLAFPAEAEGSDDFGAFIAAFETIAYHDLSLVVKFGVQFGLFGGSILFLGNRTHHRKYLRDVGSLALPGCFAMTELGHGSNVWDLETTATYDAETERFVVHTPTETARKEWIGNAGTHGRLATVFAQLHIGDDAFGVHAFLVPIRDEDGTVLPGVRVEDCGEKEGLNGVDNGRLWFDHVTIPRENLLDRFGRVTPDGTYVTPIVSPTRRFFTMLGTLVGGRVSIAAASVSAAKVGLSIAIKYSEHRRQFGPAGGAERSILDYLAQQRRLMPRLADAYALHFAVRDLADRFVNRTEEDARMVEVRAAALKAYASWFAIDTLQACREGCGGQGYLAINRIPALKQDTDIFATFEGDNSVLLQLVAKGLLTDFKQQFGENRPWSVIKFLGERIAAKAVTYNPVWTRLSDEDHLRDAEFLRSTFLYREQRLLRSLATRVKRRVDDGMNSFDAFGECQDHAITLATAYAERIIFESFQAKVEECPVHDARTMLLGLRDLYALSRFDANAGWFLECGYFEGVKSRAIRALVNAVCGEVRTYARVMVDAFGIPNALVGAPITVSIDPRIEISGDPA